MLEGKSGHKSFMFIMKLIGDLLRWQAVIVRASFTD